MFDELKQQVKVFTKLDINKLINKILKDRKFQEYILDLNRVDQLFQGIDSKGKELDGYAPYTEVLNAGVRFTYKGERRSKSAGTPIFLYDTGEFYGSFVINIGGDYFEIDADPIKVNEETGEVTDLFLNFGVDILGLTDDNLQILINVLTEKITEAIRERFK